jgi:AraC-like DNA-binding protein
MFGEPVIIAGSYSKLRTSLPSHEWKKFTVAPELGLQALHARYLTHEYERHSHDFYVIGTVDRGAATVMLGNKTITAPAGTVMIINPGEPHDGKPSDNKGYVYGMVYVDADVVERLAEEFGAQSSSPLAFSKPVVADPVAVERVRALHRALFREGEVLERECLLFDALKHLILGYTGDVAGPDQSDDCRIQRVREFIHANFDRTFTTSDLTEASGLGRSRLNQLFRMAYGLPLHAYLTGVRLNAAKGLLLSGMSGAEAAAAVGLSDQSHLIRRFRGSFGITPLQFVDAHRTSVQSVG